MAIKILNVGQCGFDGSRMETVWRNKLGANVAHCDLAQEALDHISRSDYDLILVNRVLDADHSSGLDLIRDLVKTGTPTPIMLVSNFPEAQQAAVALGAVPGFGKADLDKPGTVDMVKRVTSTRNAS